MASHERLKKREKKPRIQRKIASKLQLEELVRWHTPVVTTVLGVEVRRRSEVSKI